MDEEFVVRGPPMHEPIPEVSLGRRIYDSLSAAGPEEVAYVDAVTGRTLTHLQLLTITSRLARALQNCGYHPNDVVSISGENSIHFYVPAVASLYLGMVPAPLNHNYTQRELLHSAGIAKPKIIFCSRAVLGSFVELRRNVDYVERILLTDPDEPAPGFETVQQFSDRHCEPGFSERDLTLAEVDVFTHLSCILYSSGTTGFPKGVMTTHDNISMRMNHIRDPRIHIPHSEVIAGVLPFFHGYGFMTNIAGLGKRNTVVVMRRFDEGLFLRSVEKFRITNISIVPPILNFLAKSPKVLEYDLSSLQEITCGAAPLSEELEDAASRRFPHVRIFRQGYGLTEATLAVLLMPAGERRAGSSGKVVPGMAAGIRDASTGRLLGPGAAGELCLRGRMVTRGYYGDAPSTAECFAADGWLRTGDIARYDAEGYFYVVDRLKELIKYKGFQVAPAEIEAVLMGDRRVRDAGVVGRPAGDVGELATAFVVRADRALTEADVEECVAGQLSKPKHLHGGVRFVDEIPKNPSGKILRRRLREMLDGAKAKL